MIVIGVVAVIGFVLVVLPASLVARFLPPQIHAEDFSGTLWHGSAARLAVNSREAGACEWRLHPLALLALSVDADVHWVKISAVIDAALHLDRHGFRAQNIRGSVPIESLRDLGIAPGWQGNAILELTRVAGDFSKLTAVAGTVDINGLHSSAIAAGSDLGNYQLRLQPDAMSPDGAITATIVDQGGPLELQAEVRYAPDTHTGLLSGTLKERPEASASLRDQLQNLTQMRARDAAGRIPFELEFTL
jgi:Type II secretion system (T2SS), protein N